MINLSNKTVFITGASSGIGAACVRLFAAQGAKVIASARRQDKLQALCEQFTAGEKVEYCVLDVSNQQQIKQQLASYQNIDILINNAGLALGLDNITEADSHDWETMIDTNIKGLLYVTKQLVPQMIANQSGHIINIGSVSGQRVYPGGTVYCATKHAVDAISRGLKLELADTPLRVTNLEPGMTETEFSLVRFKQDKTRAQQVYDDFTCLSAEDIAETVLFCATRPAHVSISRLTVMPTAQKGLD